MPFQGKRSNNLRQGEREACIHPSLIKGSARTVTVTAVSATAGVRPDHKHCFAGVHFAGGILRQAGTFSFLFSLSPRALMRNYVLE